MTCLLAQGSTFLDSCDFERENICGMVQGQGDEADWVRVSRAAGGPDTDYSNMGKCTGESFFFMSVLKQHSHACCVHLKSHCNCSSSP